MNRRGSTLIELLVTLTVMAIVAGIVALSLRPGAMPTSDSLASRIERTSKEAIRRRTPVTTEIRVADTLYWITALPDGSVIAPKDLNIDRLTGALNVAQP